MKMRNEGVVLVEGKDVGRWNSEIAIGKGVAERRLLGLL